MSTASECSWWYLSRKRGYLTPPPPPPPPPAAPWWVWTSLTGRLVSWWRRSWSTLPWLWRSLRGPSWPSLEGESSLPHLHWTWSETTCSGLASPSECSHVSLIMCRSHDGTYWVIFSLCCYCSLAASEICSEKNGQKWIRDSRSNLFTVVAGSVFPARKISLYEDLRSPDMGYSILTHSVGPFYAFEVVFCWEEIFSTVWSLWGKW